jgi:hypothetical protein
VTNDRGKSDTRIDPAACKSVLRAKKHGLELHRVFDRSAIEDVWEYTLSSEGSSNGVDVAKVLPKHGRALVNVLTQPYKRRDLTTEAKND